MSLPSPRLVVVPNSVESDRTPDALEDALEELIAPLRAPVAHLATSHEMYPWEVASYLGELLGRDTSATVHPLAAVPARRDLGRSPVCEESGDWSRWNAKTTEILGQPAPWTVETAEAIIYKLRLDLGPQLVLNLLRYGSPAAATSE